jgi:molybdopterin molybdotransferase
LSEPIDIEKALELVLERVRPLPAEQVALGEALDRVLAEDVRAPWPVPRFANSAMDGFAVRAVDTAGASPGSPVRLALAGESRAGRPAAGQVGPGHAVRISTGAAMPDGADAVVRMEDACPPDGVGEGDAVEGPAGAIQAAPGGESAGEHVEVLRAVKPGHDVREAGEDIQAGRCAIPKGTILGPAELGVLASLGLARIACARRPQVAVLTTGDELLEPGEEPTRAGGVYNSNAHAVCALVKRCGADVRLRQTVPDEAPATEAALARALGGEVTILCGGVSVGTHDHVRPALAAVGAQEVFWRLALRPGGPTWFGVAPDGGLVFGLPGNPVSAMVTFLLLVRPALRELQGAAPDRDRTQAIFDEPYAKQPGRAHAVRCRLELRKDGWHARPTGPQGSHVLTSMLGADALALISTDSEGVQAGQAVEVELLGRG